MPAMPAQPYGRSGKWLTQHHGAALLKIGGVTGIRSCRAVQAEVVQARQIPDGLLEVEFDPKPGEPSVPVTGLYVVEIATYPQGRVLGSV
jgi:hypothetical protein